MRIAKLYDSSCSVSRSLYILGGRWTLLILCLALEGETRFAGFREKLGMAPNVLSERLGTLVDSGLMTREAYQEAGQRVRYEYHLTEAGRELHVGHRRPATVGRRPCALAARPHGRAPDSRER